MNDDNILVITGPTATGKTRRAVAMARLLDGEIISADSRQVYRDMNLGTGKDLEEYGDVPYHLIDICPAGYRYNLHEYLRDFAAAEELVRSRGHRVVVCGGTGMYVETMLRGIQLPPVPVDETLRESLRGKSLDELAALLSTMKTLRNTSDIDTPARAVRAIEIATYYREHPDQKALTEPHPRTDAVVVGIAIDRDTRRARITQRLRQRLDDGMVDEVRHLIDDCGIAPDDLIYYGLEYKYITLYVIGKLSRDEMFDQLEIAIHQFAKRQMTWFRGMEHRGTPIHWLAWDMPDDEFADAVMELMNR